MGEDAQAMLQAALQVREVGKGVGELLSEVMLVMAIEERTMREVVLIGEQTILHLKWSTGLSLSWNTFPFQDLSGI
jgi:hypothetical protein